MNRKRTLKAFADYVRNYDSSDAKIYLKIEHTYKVAGLCETIGRSLGLSGDALDAAWLCGMLHDIGRFEQIRRYGTFEDAKSVDHAKLSTEILFADEKRVFREFTDLEGYDDIVYTAIFLHSAYRVPEETDERTKMYCHILRDADKLDIFRVNLETPLEQIYNVTTEELYHCEVTPEVMQAFAEHHAVVRSLKKTPVDHVVGHICLAYELVWPISRRLVKEQGYLRTLMAFESGNPAAREQFGYIREEMNRYLGER